MDLCNQSSSGGWNNSLVGPDVATIQGTLPVYCGPGVATVQGTTSPVSVLWARCYHSTGNNFTCVCIVDQVLLQYREQLHLCLYCGPGVATVQGTTSPVSVLWTRCCYSTGNNYTCVLWTRCCYSTGNNFTCVCIVDQVLLQYREQLHLCLYCGPGVTTVQGTTTPVSVLWARCYYSTGNSFTCVLWARCCYSTGNNFTCVCIVDQVLLQYREQLHLCLYCGPGVDTVQGTTSPVLGAFLEHCR